MKEQIFIGFYCFYYNYNWEKNKNIKDGVDPTLLETIREKIPIPIFRRDQISFRMNLDGIVQQLP